MPPAAPTSLTIRAYNVGFGDCILLSFDYAAGGSRHVLIDFGTTAHPKTGAMSMLDIAKTIATDCGGALEAIVATHRHTDHISGFAGKPGQVIAGLHPKLVVQPWTEDPDAAEDAKIPTGATTSPQGFLRALDRMHAVADGARTVAQALGPEVPAAVRTRLEFVGEDNVKNLAAVKMLMDLPCAHKYAFYGSESGLDALLPGVKVRVLGPPTLQQYPKISSEGDDPAEFWHLQSLATRRSAEGPAAALFPDVDRADEKVLPFETRWFLPRLNAIRGDELLEVVTILDDAMNNTSLILLFEVKGKKFLFPGDAQIENWSYALFEVPEHLDVQKLLAEVNVYKVGHHGSLNATPKTLWKLFKHRGPATASDRLTSVLSTRPGKHGDSHQGTEVPRTILVDALKADSAFFDTELLHAGTPAQTVTIAL